MKRLTALLILITLCVLAWPGFASIYYSAQRGEMDKAFVLWKPLTENGGEFVQTIAAVMDDDIHSPQRQLVADVSHIRPMQSAQARATAVPHVKVKALPAQVAQIVRHQDIDSDHAGFSKDYRDGLLWLGQHADAQIPVQGLSNSMFDTVQRAQRKDKVTEYMRLSTAVKNGDEKSRISLVQIEKQMTPHQIDLANRLAGDEHGESGR